MASGIGFSLADFRDPTLIVNPFFAPVLVAGVFVVYLYTYTPPLEGCDHQIRCAGQSVPAQYQGGMYRCTVTANPRGTQTVALPCGSLYCLGLAYLGLVQIASDHSLSVGNGLNRENNNNNIAHGAMIPGRAGQRLDPCGRRTTLG